jgi:hypothetical protein
VGTMTKCWLLGIKAGASHYYQCLLEHRRRLAIHSILPTSPFVSSNDPIGFRTGLRYFDILPYERRN